MGQEFEGLTVLDEELSALIRRVGAEVLETMFFAEGVPCECRPPEATDTGVRVAFEGSHRGEFLLRVSEDARDEIAGGFLGLGPEELEDDERRQVMLELANILCGSILSSLWPESSLALSTPEPAGAELPPAGSCHQCFAMPVGMLGISVLVRGGGGV